MLWTIPATFLLATGASAHTAAFVKGMFCDVCASKGDALIHP